MLQPVTESPHLAALLSLNLVSRDDIEQIFPRCRDRDDVSVWRCRRSGVIFLSSSAHITDQYYAYGDAQSYYQVPSRSLALRLCEEDDSRRAEQFRELSRNAAWIDIGTGLGGMLDRLTLHCAEAVGVEPQEGLRRHAREAGHTVLASVVEAQDSHFDVASLFHVFEHLPDPLTALKEVKRCMKPGGHLIIEVPHARDFLLSFLDLEAFKRHTFWGQHLILHTRQSLAAFITAAGFSIKAITGFQRYPLANHLYWLHQGRPGGHKQWSFLRSESLDAAYAAKLNEMDATDTLIAIATKP
jgi:SAM-dependent methyltransferase